MLYWKYSDNRIFFLNEYWIFIPLAIGANYLIIRRIRSHRKKMEELTKLQKKIEEYEKVKKIRRLAYLTGGLSLSYLSLCRGGTDFIEGTDYVDVDYLGTKCDIEDGLSFLDNERLRKIVHDLYKHKSKGKIIYITSIALCHLADQYGSNFLALPFAVGDFGLTDTYQALRKFTVTTLLGAVGPVFFAFGGFTPASVIIMAFLGVSGLRLSSTNLDKIFTTPIDETIFPVKPRMADVPDVVVVKLRDKIVMTNPTEEKMQCFLPEQALFNNDCKIKVKPSEIPEAVKLGLGDLNYDEVVNMQDVTRLDRVDFSDALDLGQAEPIISKPSKVKTQRFLDKFGDPDIINEKDTWDTYENEVPTKRNLRGKITD